MKNQILIIDDEEFLARTVADRLRQEGFDPRVAPDGESGLRLAVEQHCDLIVLDWMLPGISGPDVCRELRSRGFTRPVLMLTARDQLGDKVLGFRLGADDYLTKPFAMAELLVRIEALLRRARATEARSGVFAFGDVRVDLSKGEVTKGGQPVDVPAKEYQLLRYLVEHEGELLSRERLLRDVWGMHGRIFTRTVDVHVALLRRRLEPDPHHPRYLLTIKGAGYKFVRG